MNTRLLTINVCKPTHSGQLIQDLVKDGWVLAETLDSIRLQEWNGGDKSGSPIFQLTYIK